MLVYALIIFLSAFLLFQIQPIIGKLVLPWFGGAPHAWAACMLFFQILLLAGYAYAHGIASRLSARRQALLHILLLAASCLFLPVIPGAHWKPVGDESPALRIFWLLSATLGAPFLLLSATGPLLQSWFSRTHPGRSPYKLYALSNLGSLLALLSYSFVVEPALTLRTQAYVWSALFVVFALLCGICGWRFQGAASISAPPEVPAAQAAPSAADRILWLLLAATGSVMLLATTNKITQDVAVVPFLWIVPLSLYLLSFILCFHSPKWYWRPFWIVALPLAVGGAYAAPRFHFQVPLALQIFIYSSTLFICCMICHGELVRLKPPPRFLTLFYFCMSAGGAVGGVFATLIAPAIFTSFWEYPIGILASCALLLAGLYRDPRSPLHGGHPRWGWAVVLLAFGGLSGQFIKSMTVPLNDAVAISRNFYGVLRVDEENADSPLWTTRTMLHGRIDHGFQYTHPRFSRIPASYYGSRSGVGMAELVLHRIKDEHGNWKSVRSGVVGLGAGVMATYAFSGDSLRFYEINPDVIYLAQNFFSFINESPAPVEIVLGDARISMEREQSRGQSQQFDILVLDAFSGDAVPLHLLTREAFDLYQYHLKPEGVLVVHTSSKYLNLDPLVRSLAEASGKTAVLVEDDPERGGMFEASSWIVITSSEEFLNSPALEWARTPWPENPQKSLLFTDDYSNLFELLKTD